MRTARSIIGISIVLILVLACNRSTPRKEKGETSSSAQDSAISTEKRAFVPVYYEVNLGVPQSYFLHTRPDRESPTYSHDALWPKLHVVGEEGEWLEVLVNLSSDDSSGKRTRAYVHRNDTWDSRQLHPIQGEIATILCGTQNGEPMYTGEEWDSDAHVTFEEIGKEQFQQTALLEGYALTVAEGTLAENDCWYIPLDSGRYLVCRDAKPDPRDKMFVKEMPYERVETLEAENRIVHLHLADATARRDEGNCAESEEYPEGEPCELDEEDCCGEEEATGDEEYDYQWDSENGYFYLGDIVESKLILLRAEPEEQESQLLFVSRTTGRIVYILKGLEDSMPYISPDGHTIIALSNDQMEEEGSYIASLQVLQCGQESVALMHNFGFPYLYCVDNAYLNAFVGEDNAVYATVVIDGGESPYSAPPSRQSYIRIELPSASPSGACSEGDGDSSR